MRVQRLFQRLGFHNISMLGRAMGERVDTGGHAFRVFMDNQLGIQPRRHRVAKRIHFAELPPRIDMQQGKWQASGVKRLDRQMQHNRAVFAN